MKLEYWSVKLIHLGLVFTVVVLGGCSTHFYKFDQHKVTIYLKNSKAQTTTFACSLDGYESRLLKQHNGLWAVTLPSDKSFKYFYMVDGEIFLPPCPLKEKDDFETENCIFEKKL